jgi:hypothetical protein
MISSTASCRPRSGRAPLRRAAGQRLGPRSARGHRPPSIARPAARAGRARTRAPRRRLRLDGPEVWRMVEQPPSSPAGARARGAIPCLAPGRAAHPDIIFGCR